MYSLERGHVSSGQLLKEPFPTLPLPQAINGGELHFRIPIAISQSSLQWLHFESVSFTFGGRGFSQKPSISLILNRASDIIDTTAKEASLPLQSVGVRRIIDLRMVSGRRADHEHEHCI